MKLKKLVRSTFIKSPQASPMIMRKEKGASLIEIIAYLGVAGMVIGGALAMYTGASSTQASNQMISDVTGVRTAVRSLWSSSANYGGVNMLATLFTASRLPTTWSVVGSGATMTAVHQLNGSVGVEGLTANFAITLDSLSEDICTSALSQQGTQGWLNVFVATATGDAAALTSGAITAFDPVTIGTACAGGDKKITLVSR